MTPIRRAYVNLQAYARRRGFTIKVDEDEFGNVEVGVFASKCDSEPFCVAHIADEHDREWIESIKFGIRDYLAAVEETFR